MGVLAASTPNGVGNVAGPPGRFYRTARFWKRFSVFLSILLSIASLIVAAYASLTHPSERTLKALTVSGVIINSISISLSALTSLDWKQQSTHDKAFAQQLCKVAHIHEGEQIVVTSKLSGFEKASSLNAHG